MAKKPAPPKMYLAKVSDLKTLGDKNPNKGTERGVYGVERSLEKNGAWRSIAATSDNVIPAGNHTLEAYVAQGGEDVLIVETDGDILVVSKRRDVASDDPRAKDYVIADNRTSEWGLDWSPEVIQGYVDAGIELGDWFQQDELAELLAGLDLGGGVGDDPGADVDRAGELQAKWSTSRGQVWEIPSLTTLGRCHRVMCGDSTSAEDVARLGAAPGMVLMTDPPYGIDVDTSWLSALHIQRGKPANKSDDKLANDDGSLDLSFLWEFERRMVWGFPYIFDPLATGWIVWDKQPGVESRGITTPIEMASTTMRKGFDMVRVMWGGYYRAAGEGDRQPHPTQKPLGVIKPYLEAWTKSADVIYDPFLGSGSMITACEQTGRIGYGMEIDPGYVGVILERLSGMGLAPRVVE